MKKLTFVLVAVLAVALVSRYAMAAETQQITGILIDEKCSKKDGKLKTEAQAAGHPAACVTKCANEGSSVVIISGEKAYKLDDASKAKALAYLAAEKGDGITKVAVEGTVKEDVLTINTIKKAEKKEARN